MHYYATRNSFQCIDNFHLKNAIKLLQPDDSLPPNRKQLFSTLLDKCHQEVLTRVKMCMKGSTCCLTTDGWSNVKNDPMVNYMVVSLECSFFLESVMTSQQQHNHKYISEDIAYIIQKYESTEFSGAVTDNTSTNKKAWTLLHHMFPSCYFQGCSSHGIHLFVKDIFAATKTKKTGNLKATYPIGYPFQKMLEFIVSCKDIAKLFHNCHVVKAQLQELQKTTNACALVCPAATCLVPFSKYARVCWIQSHICMQSHLQGTSSRAQWHSKWGARRSRMSSPVISLLSS